MQEYLVTIACFGSHEDVLVTPSPDKLSAVRFDEPIRF
jgi:hypothetical protein